jgi:hypothetical protein
MPRDWAEESFAIARDFIYPRSRGSNSRAGAVVLPEGYVEEGARYVSRRIAMAGVRLAWRLERLLAAGPPPD